MQQLQPFATNSTYHSSLHIDQQYLNRNFAVSALASANVAAAIYFVQFITSY
ncbi:hypothetical protein Nizo2726_0982 [Lactiplantibacillus plantarum]|nr:hypothetical protein AWV72_02331 [Lactiplantibacillus plantarum]KZU34468.1 hypothetical protein Nizo2726_0982 [Lactiplantibacillus plantarum]KZU52225.1 hypothetical protein Nizo2801_2223 [Lactiplantibacillus plantarum]KZU64055.1 hypothetical protein Nizo2830_2005 [Lactiplantibacillus plantarum]KZU68173.1 hypothetical protein Nizo2831_0325 [Lactiplantibacillus plantarum]